MTSARAVIPHLKDLSDRLSGPDRDDIRIVLDAIIAAAERFGERPIGQLSTKLKSVKPAAPRRRAVPPPLLGEAISICRAYRDSLGDLERTRSIISRAEHLPKTDVVAISAAVGMKTTTKTSKASALKYLLATAAQAERDREMAERIRQGA